jgi:hypothetical protein
MSTHTGVACLALLLLGTPGFAQGTDIPVPAFVELDLGSTVRFVGEPMHFRLRFGVEVGFLRDNVVQPFRRPLDVPVRIDTGWSGVAGLRPLEKQETDRALRGATCVIDGREGAATRIGDRSVDGRTFAVWEVGSSFVSTDPGVLSVPAPRLAITFATRFRDDFVAGRVAEDPREAIVVGVARSVRVEPLPVADRPPRFTGAVGRFTIDAVVEPREVVVGQPVRFTVRIEGQGDVGAFEAPRLDARSGFHVYGRIDQLDDAGRTIVYELTPLHADVGEVPPVELSYFDPGPPAGYRTIATPALSLAVRPGPTDDRLAAPEEPDDRATEADIRDPKPVAERPDSGPGSPHDVPVGLVLAALFGPWLVAAGLLAWRRTMASRAGDPVRARARAAEAVYRRERRRTEGSPLHALCSFLAVHLGTPPAAVVGDQLACRLTRHGVPEPWARRAAEHVEQLLGQRFGGAPGAVTADGLDQFVREFTRAVSRAEVRG